MTTVDPFNYYAAATSDPASHAANVTPSDTSDLEVVSRAIYVGTPGTLRVQMRTGAIVTFANAQDFLPIRVRRIYADGTTASDIVAVW